MFILNSLIEYLPETFQLLTDIHRRVLRCNTIEIVRLQNDATPRRLKKKTRATTQISINLMIHSVFQIPVDPCVSYPGFE
jgi:hypothetical protein